MSFTASYRKLYESGELGNRVKALYGLEKECALCPRNCRVKRFEGEKGVCGADSTLYVASAFPHFGEEPPLTGVYGSGTIFLSHCNLKCVFCQNYDISHGGEGQPVTARELGVMMLHLQSQGCHNINFVTPTHYAPQIVEGIYEGARLGLETPIVWNCGGYESLEVIRLLEDVVDIYMPDIKYSATESAKRYSKAPDYPQVIKQVLKEMFRQVGDLELDFRGIARRGLLIRHLVMPNNAAGTEDVLKFIANELSRKSYVNIMDQYRPLYKAFRYPQIARPITRDEYESAISIAKQVGLSRGFTG
ncbi:MAG: HEPN domain-containing protein [Nitrospinae bacterium]|nr:HEPN domain-containing protein [Nitrospinota bacterium]